MNGEKSLYEKANRFSGEVIFAAAGGLMIGCCSCPLGNTIITPGKDYKQIIIWCSSADIRQQESRVVRPKCLCVSV
jgi:hypothetical protein